MKDKSVTNNFFNSYVYGHKFFGGTHSLEYARKCLKVGEVHVKIDVHCRGSYYNYYGGIPLSILKDRWQTDKHIYEVLSDRRKPYFDLDFFFVNEEEEQRSYEAALQFISDLMGEVGAPFTLDQLAVSCVRSKPSVGRYANRTKSSYHIIVNNGYVFNSLEDTVKFRHLIRYRKKNAEGYSLIDSCVYDKNRVFKLPYQTKGVDLGSRQP